MSEPARKHPEIDPNIRPKLGVIEGGGESTSERGNLSEVQNDNATAQDLSSQERRFGVVEGGGESTPERGDLRSVKSGEEARSWSSSYDGSKAAQKQDTKTKVKLGIKRFSPAGIALLLIGGGGILGGGGFFASIGGINFKEIVTQKLDSMTAVLTERSDQAFYLRLFSPPDPTSKGCAIKVKCRYKGMTERQMQRLEIQGAQLVGKDGKRVTKNKFGRYTGGQKLILPNGDAVDATQFKAALRDAGGKDVRSVLRGVFAPRYISWNDKIAKDIRIKKRMTSNGKWGKEGDEKEGQKQLAKAAAGEDVNASADDKNTQYQKNPDGSDKLDSNGNKIPVQQAPGSAGLDLGDDAENINDEAERLRTEATNGTPRTPLPDDVASVAAMQEYQGKFSATKGIKSVIGFLNPLDLLSGFCTVYQMINLILVLTITYYVAEMMRVMAQFFSTWDRIKEGSGTPDDAEKSMSLMQQADQFGDSYGESFTYNYAAYGTVTDIALGASARGNEAIKTLATVMRTTNEAVGGRTVAKNGCNILTNPVVQGALALTSFIPGEGQLANAGIKVLSKEGMALVKNAIKEQISSFVAKNLTKEGLKASTKAAGKNIIKIAKSKTTAIFLGAYLFARYGVPYIAQLMSYTSFTGAGGKKLADGMGGGLDSYNAITARSRGFSMLTKKQALAYDQFNKQSTGTYIADMQADANPFDFNNPYSAGNRLAAAVNPLLSHLDFTQPSKVLSLPGAIVSSLKTNTLFSNTAFADAQDDQDALNYCQDEYFDANDIASTPYCNEKYGVRDIGMLTGVDPDKVIDYMHDNKQIDDNGDPVPDSPYAKFVSECVTGSDEKFVGDFGEDNQEINPDCYNSNDQNYAREMYHLYYIDTYSVAAPMDDEQKSAPAQTAAAAPAECATMAADDLGQIACHAYQFDPYGYKWEGGHGSSAQGFMTDFKAGKYAAGKDHILDCSGLVRMSIFDATGVDIGGMGTSGYPSYAKFTEVNKQDAKAGDILWRSGHTEIVVSNDPGAQKWQTFGAHDVNLDINKDIGPTSYKYSDYTKVFRFVK